MQDSLNTMNTMENNVLQVEKKNNRRKIAILTISIAICFVFGLLLVPSVNAGFGPMSPRTQSVQDFAEKSGFVSQNVIMNITTFGSSGAETGLVSFTIPGSLVSVQTVIPESGVYSLWQPEEQLKPHYLNIIDLAVHASQLYQTNMSLVNVLNSYPWGNTLTPIAQNPFGLDLNKHAGTVYSCIMPSAGQFATILCQQNGWQLNNITYAATNFQQGFGGAAPCYYIQNYGVPCQVDNQSYNTSVINLIPIADSIMQSVNGQMTGAKTSYGTFIAFITGHSGFKDVGITSLLDDLVSGISMGTMLISGLVPSGKTIISDISGSPNSMATMLSNMYFNSLNGYVLGSSADNSTMKSSADDYSNIIPWIFLQMLWSTQEADNWRHNYNNLLASIPGLENHYYRMGYEQALLDFYGNATETIDAWSQENNVSAQAVQSLLNGIDNLYFKIKSNITLPFQDALIAAVGYTNNLPWWSLMPSEISIVIIVTVSIAIGSIIIVVIIWLVVKYIKRRKGKDKQANQPEGTQVNTPPKQIIKPTKVSVKV